MRPRESVAALAAASAALLLILLLAGCSLSDGGPATEPLETNSLQPLAGMEPRSFFGDAVAIDGGAVAVGAWGAQAERGAVRLYGLVEDDWQATQLLRPPEVQEGDRFGHALALDGDELVVGAPRSTGEDGSDSAGAVYYFRRTLTDWRLQQVITAPPASGGSHFGSTVALESGTLAVVAAGAGEQALHIFTREGDGWSPRQSFALDSLGVGQRLAMSEDLIAVGARSAGGSSAVGDQGLLRTFALVDGSWAEVPAPVAAEPGECFGCAVAVSGDLLAVGSPSPTGGASFLFRRTVDGWVPLGRVSGGSGSAHFGQAVALGSGVLLVGAPGDDGAGENVGRVFAYSLEAQPLAPVTELSPPALPANSSFGATIDTDSATVVVGAPGLERASGAVYLRSVGF